MGLLKKYRSPTSAAVSSTMASSARQPSASRKSMARSIILFSITAPVLLMFVVDCDSTPTAGGTPRQRRMERRPPAVWKPVMRAFSL